MDSNNTVDAELKALKALVQELESRIGCDMILCPFEERAKLAEARVRELEAELAAEHETSRNDPAEQRAERYAMEALDLSGRLIAAEAKVQELEAEVTSRINDNLQHREREQALGKRVQELERKIEYENAPCCDHGGIPPYSRNELIHRVQELEQEVEIWKGDSSVHREALALSIARVQELEREIYRISDEAGIAFVPLVAEGPSIGRVMRLAEGMKVAEAKVAELERELARLKDVTVPHGPKCYSNDCYSGRVIRGEE